MDTYLPLKHDRGAPAPVDEVPMDQWTPERVSDRMQHTHDVAARLEATGE